MIYFENAVATEALDFWIPLTPWGWKYIFVAEARFSCNGYPLKGPQLPFISELALPPVEVITFLFSWVPCLFWPEEEGKSCAPGQVRACLRQRYRHYSTHQELKYVHDTNLNTH